MNTSTRSRYRLLMRLVVASLTVAALLSGGVARAQDDAVSSTAATPQVFLPLLATAGSPPLVEEAPPIGQVEDGNIDGLWSTPRNDQG
jgi:hypothetical protein